MLFKNLLVTGFYLLLFNYLFYRFKSLQLKGYKAFVTPLLFNLKFITGIFVWCIYTFYYKDIQNNDIHKFYNDALVLRNAAAQNTTAFLLLATGIKNDSITQPYTAQMKNWERNFDEAPINENRTIIRINALLMFLTFRTYFAHILIMCFVALVGWVLIFNSVFASANGKPGLLALLVLLLPSVLFWASAVIKEPILVFGLGLFVYGLIKLRSGVQDAKFLTTAFLLVTGALILLSIKFYVLACLLPASLAFLLLWKAQKLAVIITKYVFINIFLLTLAFSVQNFIPRINLPQMLVNKQRHAIKEAEYFNAGSLISIPAITPDAYSIIKTAPVGIWNSILRPYLWEGRNPMMLASALENLLVLAIIVLALLYRNKSGAPVNLILFLLTFSLTYFALIGICTPVLGNLVRYKAPVLPIFLFSFILLANETRIQAKMAVLARMNNLLAA
jgi:hypothetical protein